MLHFTICIISNNLDKILTNNKEIRSNTFKNDVYCISCEQCHNIYYGQTGRNLSTGAV